MLRIPTLNTALGEWGDIWGAEHCPPSQGGRGGDRMPLPQIRQGQNEMDQGQGEIDQGQGRDGQGPAEGD